MSQVTTTKHIANQLGIDLNEAREKLKTSSNSIYVDCGLKDGIQYLSLKSSPTNEKSILYGCGTVEELMCLPYEQYYSLTSSCIKKLESPNVQETAKLRTKLESENRNVSLKPKKAESTSIKENLSNQVKKPTDHQPKKHQKKKTELVHEKVKIESSLPKRNQIIASDTESEGEEERDLRERIMPSFDDEPMVEPEPEPIVQIVQQESGKRKVKRKVEKQYVKGGYIHTEIVEEMVSEEEPAKEVVKKSKPQQQKMVQRSLMDFCKK